MATKIVLTKAADFCEVPVINANLMSIKPGLDSFYALSLAGALESAVRSRLRSGTEDLMDAEITFLCHFALDAAMALRNATSGASL